MGVITFITGNQKKAERIVGAININLVHKDVDLPEIQSFDIREVVEHKVREAYKHVDGPVLVEDVSLCMNALGGLPGPFIKWHLKAVGNNGLCMALNAYGDRSAVAHVCFGLFDGKEVRFFENEKPGTISLIPRGEEDFGWDPVFVPEGATKTYAEMDDKEKKIFSMRNPALKQLEAYLTR